MILFLLHLAGAAALLIWAVRLIRTGVERAFMARLRLLLRRSASHRVLTAGAGTLAAMLLQSSTAVALIVAGFAATGGMAAAAALLMVLGADLGSALAAQILLARPTAVLPLLLLAGTVLFLKARRRSLRQSGRALIGLALVFVSLDMIHAATAPLTGNRVVGDVVAYLDGDLLSAFVLGALLAWAVHSSLAAVLLFVTFVAGGVASAQVGAALVLGANLGGAAIPLLLTLKMPAPARRVLAANLVLRGGGALLAVLALMFLAPDMTLLGAGADRQVINLHMLFNAALVLVSLPLAGPLVRLAARAIPEAAPGAATPTALDPEALETPDRALARTGRELLRMTERVTEMLTPALSLYKVWDDRAADAILRAEEEIDRIHFDAKLYLARLQEQELTTRQSRRAINLAAMASNLEDAGDQISSHMLGMARRMHAGGLAFSPEGWRDLTDFHDMVLANARLASDLLMSDDADIARQLLEEKDNVRRHERDMQQRHLERLRRGTAATVETSNLHQETVRALKHVNTALCFVAYPIAEESGDLRASRLVDAEADEAPRRPLPGRGKRKADA